MILLDTDVAIDALREHAPALSWLRTQIPEKLLLPGFVAMELIQGCVNRADQRRVEKKLRDFRVVWLGPADCAKALELFAERHLSHSLGLLDALIARTAISLATPLHTFNVKHYIGIANLRTVQPYPR